MIRPATLADVDRILEMSLAFIAGSHYAEVLVPDVTALRATTEAFCGADPDRVVLLSVLEEQIVGMLALIAYVQPFTGQRVAGEMVWWVEPAHRGQGGRLLIAGERWAHTRGAQSLQMLAPTPSVESLYERHGYQALERLYQRTLVCS